MRRLLPATLLLALVLTPSEASAKAKITIQNSDAAGVGFNDTTPVEPIGGNEGRTLGEQRLNSFRRAAEIWGNIINSDVEIVVEATFAPRGQGTSSRISTTLRRRIPGTRSRWRTRSPAKISRLTTKVRRRSRGRTS
jgi:hypothetical protein